MASIMRIVCVISVLVLLSVSTDCSKLRRRLSNNLDTKAAVNFDILSLRKTWPRTRCLFPGKNTCKIEKEVQTWTIHGLWPSNRSGAHPFYCDSNNKFNINLLSNIVPSLKAFWPNLYTNTAPNSFWTHEWDKHGTCALGISRISNQLDFFTVSLELRDRYDVGTILERASIVPNDFKKYELSKIKAALDGALKVGSLIYCFVPNSSPTFQYLFEVQICFDKQYKLVNCGSSAYDSTVSLSSFDGEIQTGLNVPASSSKLCQTNLPVIYPTI